MNNNIYIILFIILIILFLFIINRKKNTEHFSSDPWTTNKDVLALEKAPLNDTQKTEVKNMITSITNSQLKTLISTQSPLLTGPQGTVGPQGPPGTTLVASGRLVNKSGSYDKSNKSDYFNPKYVVTRTEGTNPTSSLSFMDFVSPFVSFQNWNLDVNNNIKNRYDDNCLTMSTTQDNLYIDKCDNNNNNQKWSWDKSNRIVSTTASTSSKLKCIGLTDPEQNVVTTNIPDCTGQNCVNNTPRRFLSVKDCDINNVNEDEIWSFV